MLWHLCQLAVLITGKASTYLEFLEFLKILIAGKAGAYPSEATFKCSTLC
jgi:hypothetical protein